MVGAGGIFVTGTDTNVGKTVIACLIARGLRRYGIDCGVMKPVQCGGRDARRLMRAAGAKDSLSLVLPMFSPYACAPSIALPRAGVRFSPARIKQAYRKLSLRHEFMVVEGAGGVLAPLAAKYFILDLIQDLGLPAVVVAAAGLGTINHTLLTIECLRARGIKILGLIFNNLSPRRDISQTHNPRLIGRICSLPVLGVVPFGAGRLRTPRPGRQSRRGPRVTLSYIQDVLREIFGPGKGR